MTALFLVVLVLAWLVVFLPATTRGRHRAPLTSTEQFKKDLATIALPRSPLAVAASLASRPSLNVRTTRLVLFLFMCGSVVVTFGALFVRGMSVLDAHLVADAALLSYVSWLLEERRKRPRKVVRSRPAVDAPARAEAAPPTWWDVRIVTEDELSEEKVLEEQPA